MTTADQQLHDRTASQIVSIMTTEHFALQGARAAAASDTNGRTSLFLGSVSSGLVDGYNAVKRLLGLAYFWVGSANGVQVQLWAIWLLYAVLVDLTDAVAEELDQPFAALSLEMVYRSLYFFTAADQRGEATDIVPYLAAEAADLGIVKRKRKRDPTPSRFDQLRLTFASTA